MEKTIARWAFWLGLASVSVTLIWRGLNAMGVFVLEQIAAGQTIYYMSFYKAALLFFVTSIAAANYAWLKSQKS